MATHSQNEGFEELGHLTPAAALSAGVAKLIPSLPLETRCSPFPLRRLAGFWLPEMVLPGVAAGHTCFEPRPDDVFLTSFPKSGTTWLKALAFATLRRAEYPPSDPAHPLRHDSPHEAVRFLELDLAAPARPDDNGCGQGDGGGVDVFRTFPSPRVLATHLPYHLLPERITADSSGCRIVYVCRDPKDAFVSGWFFFSRKKIDQVPAAADDATLLQYPLEEAFELFCDGRSVGGPQWLHVLRYWEESRRRPGKVLFLHYEEMLREPATIVKMLAEFLGCPFSGEEDAAGTVDAIVDLCSLGSLKKASGTGVTEHGINKASFFRKGVAGDWRSHMSPEMAAKLDSIVDAALQGTGFTFATAGSS